MNAKKTRKRKETLIDAEYFFNRSMPEPNSGCWIWTGRITEYGYGRFSNKKVARQAHRASLEISIGKRLNRMEYACHKCDVRCCVNPDHMYVGSQLDNMRDMIMKGRSKSKLTKEDIMYILQSREPQSVLASLFSVTQSTISNVKLGKVFPHITKQE